MMFPQVFKAIKLYLSVPACTTTAERSFSCLKLIKTWLRSTMKSERLSNLAIIKMNNVKKMEFQLDVNQVIDDFISISKSGRNLKLIIPLNYSYPLDYYLFNCFFLIF